jgi:putative multiple sugar transport system ATP-binding protein
VRLLILDEPTASLNETDCAALLALLREFRAQGITSILISHKLNEIREVADKITVLRDGKAVATLDCHAGEVEEDDIIRKMVDRDLESRYPKRDPKIGDVIFEVDNWSVYHPLHPERHSVRTYVQGAGGRNRRHSRIDGRGPHGIRHEPVRAFLGERISAATHASTAGRLIFPPWRGRSRRGLAYVTEDRKKLGLVLGENISRNISLAHLRGVSPKGIIDDIREMKIANSYREQMSIRCHNVYQETGTLSGGNQQKVVLSKWLFTGPDVLILDEPTRGIDVGAKYDIYTIINSLADSGKGVVVISSEMPELIGICDRIVVMHEGAFVGEVAGEEATQENIMRAIMRNKGKRQ